jgi:hypothetical protein
MGSVGKGWADEWSGGQGVSISDTLTGRGSGGAHLVHHHGGPSNSLAGSACRPTPAACNGSHVHFRRGERNQGPAERPCREPGHRRRRTGGTMQAEGGATKPHHLVS